MRLTIVSVEYFIRGGSIQTLVRLDSIVEVNEAEKLDAPIVAVFKAELTVPHIHPNMD